MDLLVHLKNQVYNNQDHDHHAAGTQSNGTLVFKT